MLDLKTKRMVLRGVCLKIQNATESRYFRLWSDNVAKLMRDRVAFDTDAQAHKWRRRVYAAFSAWADLSTAHEDRLDKIIDIMNGRMRRVHLAKAFAGWLDKAQAAIATATRAAASSCGIDIEWFRKAFCRGTNTRRHRKSIESRFKRLSRDRRIVSRRWRFISGAAWWRRRRVTWPLNVEVRHSNARP